MSSLLFVDDEQPILRSLHRLFRETDHSCFFAESGKEALAVLEKNEIELIVSDMRMPGMNGHELLKIVKERYPGTMRLILSGYAQEQEIFRAIMDGSAKMYLLKPWNNENLLHTVDSILKSMEMLRNKKLLDKIEQMDRLPTLSSVYHRLCKMIEQEAEIKHLVPLIEGDPVIAGKVLQFANSAFVGIRTGSIQQAIAYLGLSVLKSIVLASSILDSSPTDTATLVRQESLWKHASLTNKILLSFCSQLLKRKVPDEWAAAGLLHDIGKIVLLKQYNSQYLTLYGQLVESENMEFMERETEVFGISHPEIGGYLLNWWQLPYPIVEAALFHHMPLAAPVINKEVVSLVHLSDYYAWRAVKPADSLYLDSSVFELLGLRQEDCEKVAAMTVAG